MNNRYLPLLCCCVALSAATTGWRIDGTGMQPDERARTEWTPQTSPLWQVDLKGWTNATPVIVGDKLLTRVEPATTVCLERSSGKELWRASDDPLTLADLNDRERQSIESEIARYTELKTQFDKERRKERGLKRKADSGDAKAKAELEALTQQLDGLKKQMDGLAKARPFLAPSTHNVTGYTAYTPAVSGDKVVVANGYGIVACYALESGERLWHRKIENPDHGWGGCCSPIIVGDRVVVRFNQYVGLDLASGEEVWRQKLSHCFGTPISCEIGGVPVVITPWGSFIKADDGTMLARNRFGFDGYRDRFSTPLLQDGIIYCVDGYERRESKAIAFKLPASVDELRSTEPLWQTVVEADRFYASAVIFGGKLHSMSARGTHLVVDPATGRVESQGKIADLRGGTIYPSPAVIGDKLYISSDNGTTVVFDEHMKQLAVNRTDPFRACPVAKDGKLYLRTLKRMMVLGGQ